mmetsp:Transcript_42089/g.67126  ORF Transcript_42089/g.67126 Transcript_42089/m.67126 type:complete len:901 (+) Transcript_42089:90-2792(+)
MTTYDADLVGRWTYEDTFYDIGFDDSVDGKYVFAQECTGAHGVLECGSEWLEGHVKLGTIRLKLTEDGTMFSQFKPDSKSEWGKGIVASRYFEPSESSPSLKLAPSLSQILGKLSISVFISILVAVALPTICIVLCTSDFTPLGKIVYDYFVHRPQITSGLDWYDIFLLTGVVMLLVGYLIDAHLWEGNYKFASVVYFKLAVLCFLAGALFFTKVMPSIPIVIGVAITILSVVFLRHTVFRVERADVFALGTSIAFLVLSLAAAVVWFLWAFTPLLGGFNTWKSNASDIDKHERLIRFVRWSAPMLLSMAHFLIFCMTLTMSRFLQSTSKTARIDAGEIKASLCSCSACFLLAWIASTLMVYSMDLSKAIMRLAAVWLIGTMIYVAASVGFGRIRKAVESSSSFALIVWFIKTDWFRGIFLILLWPILPAYFGVEVMHKHIRTQITQLQMVNVSTGAEKVTDWLTGHAWLLWYEMTQVWDKSAVLLCSMYVGIIFFVVQVCFVNGLTLLLAWASEKMALLPLWSIVLGLYVLGLLLFLLPPCPGCPVYLLAAMIMTSRCLEDKVGGSAEIGFWIGTFASVVFCFLLKMSAIVLEQKAIGEPFSRNVDVKKMIGVQTEQIKSVRHILKKPGMPIDKVAVLVGGPDWPTSVLTGILRLRIADMLLGSSPVIFVIIPIVMAAAFQVRAGHDHPSAHVYQSMATILMMVATLVQLGAFMLAGYYMQAEADEHREDISDWEQDDQETEVIESMALDSQRSQFLERMTGWSRTPLWLRLFLFLGSILASCMFHIVVDPFFRPFKEFTLTDRISDLPGGSPMSLINRTGWWAISLFCAVTLIVAMHQLWCLFKTRGLAEQAPLNPRRPSAYGRSGSLCSAGTHTSAASKGSVMVGTYSTMREGDLEI